MKHVRLALPTVFCGLILLAACGGGPDGGDAAADVPDAVVADIPDEGSADTAGSDVLRDMAGGDEQSDVPADDVVETYVPPEPDHTFVHEVRQRATCVSDGPWKIDHARQHVGVLPGLEIPNIIDVEVSGGQLWVLSYGGVFAGTLESVAAGEPMTRIPSSFWVPGDGVIAPFGAGLAVRLDQDILIQDGAGTWQSMDADVPQGPGHMVGCQTRLFLAIEGRLYEFLNNTATDITDEMTGTVNDIACAGTALLAATDSGIWELGGDGTWGSRLPYGEAPITSISAGGTLIAYTEGNALSIVDVWNSHVVLPGPGGLPAGEIRDVAVSPDGRFVAVTHEVGVTVLDTDPGDPESMAVNRADVGQDQPAVVDYFHSMRWMPSDAVNDVAFDATNGDLWVATPAGLSRIRRENTMLEDKAGRMFDNLDRWFWRLDGFVAAEASFEGPYSDVRLALRDNDNDGQWTQEAVGAFCYAYRVTGDERYYEAAHKAITNMAMQIDIPAQDFIDAGLGRGFVTRSFVRDDEGALFTEKDGQSNWHLVEDYADGHDYYWKDDTSSDELTGHFYGFSIYYDLCAKDDEERAWVADHLTALVGYILDHGFYLLDIGGEPTEHGKYAPEVLAVAVDGLEACTMTTDLETCIGSYYGGAFLDSTEILGGLLAAWHVSGEQRFYDAYESLISEYRYDELATFHPDVLTWSNPAIANYCDHELSDLALLTLIRYEQRDDRRAIWIQSMLDAWAFEVGERNPLKSLTMSAAVADAPGLVNGVSTLVDFPEDQRDYLVDNSHRVDAGRMGKDRFQTAQFDTVLPYDEIHTMRWDSNPYRVSDGGSPTQRKAPNFWLLPYWGLRYYNVICE